MPHLLKMTSRVLFTFLFSYVYVFYIFLLIRYDYKCWWLPNIYILICEQNTEFPTTYWAYLPRWPKDFKLNMSKCDPTRSKPDLHLHPKTCSFTWISYFSCIAKFNHSLKLEFCLLLTLHLFLHPAFLIDYLVF